MPFKSFSLPTFIVRRGALAAALALAGAACQAAPVPEGGDVEQAPESTSPGASEGDDGASGEAGQGQGQGQSEGEGDAHGPGDGIAWHAGDVDSAFAEAAESGKPVFLYWGAEWCPPCYYLKTKVFVKPEFIAKSQDFVNVYLDGDTERAQIVGEEFGVAGYPTVIVFDPAGQEIMRLPNDLPVERFTEALDTARALMRPVADVLADVRATGAANASPDDLRTLAYYAWSQDETVNLPDEERFDLFRTLYEETPETEVVTRSRFFTEFMNAAIDRASERASAAEEESEASGTAVEPEPVFTAEEAAAHAAEVARILQDSELRDANYSFVVYWSRETVELLHPKPSPERDTLIALWDATAQAIENDEGQTLDDRLTALYPRLELARIAVDEAEAAAELAAESGAGDEGTGEAETAAEGSGTEGESGMGDAATTAGESASDTESTTEGGDSSVEGDSTAAEAPAQAPGLPAELVAHVRDRVAWARQQPMQPGEPQTVISTLAWLLEEIEADEEATDLLAEAMDETHAPYYYMSWIGSLKKSAEEPEEAVEWYRMAYDNATGRYTRFRWGASYLQTLMDLMPEEASRIEADSFAILGELLEHEDAFSLGNLLRLGQYESALLEWNEAADGAHQGAVDRIRQLVHAACPTYATPEELALLTPPEAPDSGEEAGDEGAAESGSDGSEGTAGGDSGSTEAGEGEGQGEGEGEGADAAAGEGETEEEVVETQFTRCLDFLAVDEEEAPTG